VSQRSPQLRARAVWHPSLTHTTNLQPGRTQPLAARPLSRRQIARAVWSGTVSRTTNASAAPPVSGKVPAHLIIAGRAEQQRSRVSWRGTTVRTVNAPAPKAVQQPHLVIAGRKLAARAVWAGTRAVAINAPPVAFQVARSVATVGDLRDGTALVTAANSSALAVSAVATSAGSVSDPRDGSAGVSEKTSTSAAVS
jgi:hypothetical protein